MLRKQNTKRFKYSNILCFILIIPCFIFSSFIQTFASTQVSLEWNPNSEPDLAGYRVFSREEGKSYDYTNPIWEGTNNYCTIDNPDETKNYYFVARAFNTSRLESGDSNEVFLEAAPIIINQPPAANAGPAQIVEEGKIVTLDGSNSTDPDDGIASYQWVQTGGPKTTLSDTSSKAVTFTAPDIGPEGASLTFELTVVDHSGLESKDSCIVNITWLNEPPQVDAGNDQTVDEGVMITLDGSSSIDIDDGIASYFWTQTSGPEVFLYNPTSSQPTFTAPNVGPDDASLSFNLTVTDTHGLQNSDSCIVNISWQNETPKAVLGIDYIDAPAGTVVTLDGSKSTDTDDGIVSYLWTQVDGKPVKLSDPTSKITTFIAPESDQNGTNLTFKLTVIDSGGLKDTADCLVYVTQSSLTQEAEEGKLFGAFEIASDPAASGGQYVHVPNGTGGSGLDETNKIEYTFKILETGIYRIKCWVHAVNGSDDSFWVKVNGSPSKGYLWDVFKNTSYQTDYVNDRDGADPVEVMLKSGINVVTIYQREDGTRLDKIELEPTGGN